mgnify:FL=1|tara:strand:+ start:763 stop:1452 length:690 start_codon:yes stop_codon:yes gene_type:complete
MIHILNATGGSEEINDIKYEGQPNERDTKWMKKPTPLVTLDWIDLLPPPPSNISDSTKIDLQRLEKVTRNLSYEDFDLIMLVDKEPSNLFLPYLKVNGLRYPKKLIDLVLDNVYPIWLKLKYHHRRPRPFQLAPHLGFVISVLQTKTHQTPAYPSGHQTEGSIAAEVLSSIYPEHKNKFYEIAHLVGKARVLQGVHYQSDNDASMTMVKLLWANIKGNLNEEHSKLIKE